MFERPQYARNLSISLRLPPPLCNFYTLQIYTSSISKYTLTYVSKIKTTIATTTTAAVYFLQLRIHHCHLTVETTSSKQTYCYWYKCCQHSRKSLKETTPPRSFSTWLPYCTVHFYSINRCFWETRLLEKRSSQH